MLVGFALGFAVAAQLGPISLLAIRSTLRHGAAVGLAIGAAVALVDMSYAAAGAAGAAGILSVKPLRLVAGLTGAAVLAALGLKTLWSAFRVRLGGEGSTELAAPRRAFLVALGATASNPLTIASWAAIFAAASTAGADGGVLTFAGVGVGSFTWMVLLTGAVSLARRRVGDRLLRATDALAGSALVAFGGVLAYRTVRDG